MDSLGLMLIKLQQTKKNTLKSLLKQFYNKFYRCQQPTTK